MSAQVTYRKNGQVNVMFKEGTPHFHLEEPPRPVQTLPGNPFERIEREFSDVIGLDELKDTLKEIYASVYVSQKRQAAGLKASKQVLHMVFKGNPGTGKTTVARKLAKLFHELNVLSKGHFIEAERADLVGEYIGHTAQKTRDMIKKALGGVLFIDEAYSLARGGEKDFGKEAIDTMVKHMEDHHNDFILVLAGYPKEMDQFMKLNPGLQSRFPIVLPFDDYSVEELMIIAKQMAEEREYELSKEAEWKLKQHMLNLKAEEKEFSNGRFVRNVIEQSIRKHAIRVMKSNSYSHTDLMLLTSADIHYS
ncbi:stage V sporulation protein K [Pontibacillus halophilus JSM 076056 = DSM 19796]|uniref:Stage V sporulation protein K n=1 Tax=Pontibacillus halophilus JSM 076056 = DSM 19796 TaxID=1385510 RepID=A0A0A5GIL4_9BACI|nr:stage V sporulation protein K [Pontibacillus halophilus]KGX93086.1 stage V sporulation protein K [Pontibacillus halophilus JSM 076056 = DSM 19796]